MIFRIATLFNYFLYHFPKIFYFFKKKIKKKMVGVTGKGKREKQPRKP